MSIADKYRIDYMFSYWVFAAYLLFYFHIIPYNPKQILILAVFVNLIQLVRFIWNHMSLTLLLLFIIINIFIKIVPLYTIRKTYVTKKDNLFYLGLFFVYLFWIFINDVDPIDIYFHNKKNTQSQQSSTPLSNIIISLYESNRKFGY